MSVRIASARRTGMLWALAIVVLVITARSLVFILFEQAQFDADQAVMGLMAKHIAQRRAFPFYVYAENYLFVIEAWLSAPFVGLLGTSVAALRVPLLLLNYTAGGLLVWMLSREGRLRPIVAVVPALFFIAAPPVLSAELLTAIGGNIEPFLYVLLLWLVRERPIAFGVIFAVGFMNREFTAYAVSALLAVEALQRRLWQPVNLRRKAIAAAVFAAAWPMSRLLRQHADVLGPGTAGMGDLLVSNVTVAAGFVCPVLEPERITANLTSLVTTQLGILLGASPFRLKNVNIVSPTSQGMPGLWPVFCAVMLTATLRAGWLGWASRCAPVAAAADPRHTGAPHEASAQTAPWFALYLALIGGQAALVWAFSRCDPLHPMTLRYALLAVFVPIAIVSFHLTIERRALLRNLMIGFVLTWAGLSLRAHAELLTHYAFRSRPSEYRLIADALVARSIRYVQTDYWAAYMIDFLTDERVVATPTDRTRILEYELEVGRHLDRAVLLSREPCPDGQPIRYWYLCKATE